MITPSFRCRQDRGFVIVEIYLPSIHCKVSNAEFDITPFQFTFHCSPYYLRLQFESRRELTSSAVSPTAVGGKSEGLCEGKGERATYDLATSTMTVYLPKAVDGEYFLYLDMPNLLLATSIQRKAMLKPKIEVIATSESDAVAGDEGAKGQDEEEWEDEEEEDDAVAEDELETEFVQMSIDGNGMPMANKKGTAAMGGAPNHEDEEAKMAVKTAGTDSSLLGLEAKMDATPTAVGVDGWSGIVPPSPITDGITNNAGNGKDGASSAIIKEGYGFNNEFTNVFAVMTRTDAQQNTDYVREVVDVTNPDKKSQLDRRQERLLRETKEYDDAAFWGCVNEDATCSDSELGELFAIISTRGRPNPDGRRFVPWYLEAFEAQLQSSGMTFVSLSKNANSSNDGGHTTAAEAAASLLPQSGLPKHAIEEDGEENAGSAPMQAATSGVILAWEGNTGTIVHGGASSGAASSAGIGGAKKPLISAVTGHDLMLPATAADTADAPETAASVVLSAKPVAPATSVANAHSSANAVPAPDALRLAIPTVPPIIVFTKEEAQLLLHIQPRQFPITPIPSSAEGVCALLVDLLCAFTFDYLTTFGDGNVESIWTVTKLSPSLTFLDQPRNVYEALVGFSRRVFIYPYLRHWALIHRVIRDVGVILLSGPQAVIKALLGLKHVLDNTEHHHMLSKLYVNPAIGYLSGCLRSEEDTAAITSSLQRTAVEMHQCMTFEPSEEVASGAVDPPHIVDMLCDGLDGAMDEAEAEELKRTAAATAMAAAEAAGASSSSGKGLVLQMLKESADKAAEKEKAKQQQQRCRGGAIQYEPLAPFTLGLPIDMEEEEETDDI